MSFINFPVKYQCEWDWDLGNQLDNLKWEQLTTFYMTFSQNVGLQKEKK